MSNYVISIISSEEKFLIDVRNIEDEHHEGIIYIGEIPIGRAELSTNIFNSPDARSIITNMIEDYNSESPSLRNEVIEIESKDGLLIVKFDVDVVVANISIDHYEITATCVPLNTYILGLLRDCKK